VGKTTLLERAIRVLQGRGLSVLAVKSSHHGLPDLPGSDSHRLSQAGAHGTALLGSNGSHLYLDPPLRMEELLPLLATRYQVALIEGGKSSSYPKVELLAGQPPLLSEQQVVGRLQRDGQSSLDMLLEFLDRQGQLLGGAND
jgi:molybdopterin-guanine dinucleotide biosynthesis protein MobB